MAFVFAAATSLLPANQCHALAKISMRCTPAMNAAERRDARNSFGMQPGMQPGFDMRGGGYDMPGGGGHQRGGGYDMPDGGMHGGFMPGMQGGFGPMQGARASACCSAVGSAASSAAMAAASFSQESGSSLLGFFLSWERASSSAVESGFLRPMPL